MCVKTWGELTGRALAPPPCAMHRRLMALPDASELCANSSITASSPRCLFCNHGGACREMGVCGGARGDGDGYGDRGVFSLPGPASCIPTWLQAELEDRSRPQRAQRTMPRDLAGGRWLPYFCRANAGGTFRPFGPSPFHPNAAAPELSSFQGASNPPGHCPGVPHPYGPPVSVLIPLASGAGPLAAPVLGGTGTRRLCLTKQSSVFLFSPISLQHRKAVESLDLRCDKHWGLC